MLFDQQRGGAGAGPPAAIESSPSAATGASGRQRDRRCRVYAASIVATFFLVASRPGHASDSPTRTATGQTGAMDETLRVARETVDKASRHGAPWLGPQTGPSARPGKTIAFVAGDLRNGGIVGVAQGVREASAVIGWSLKLFDAGGSAAGLTKALGDAFASRADGLVLCGPDALQSSASLRPFSKAGRPIVGWHAGPRPGPIAGAGVATNITTDPLEVARVAAMAAIVQSRGRAGVVIFTDSRFAIAMTKAKVMAQTIEACGSCALLEVQDVPLSDSAARMPGLTDELLARYGRRFTVALAINDIYFDYAVPVLTKAGLAGNDLSLLSAGDGSSTALLRIQARTFQTATVAEPLRLHGWQAVDELNRLFADEPVSGFVAPVHLVTAENIAFDRGTKYQYDPDNHYRDVYRRIWKR